MKNSFISFIVALIISLIIFLGLYSLVELLIEDRITTSYEESFGYKKVVKTYYLFPNNFPTIIYEPKIGDMGRTYGSSPMGNYSDCIVDDTCPN